MHGNGTFPNATPQPPLTNSDYERHHIITRHRRRSIGANPAKAKVRSTQTRRVSNTTMQVCTTPMQLPPSYMGEGGDNAELSDLSGSQSFVTSCKTQPSIEVLQSVLEMLNCIGAILTLGPEDTLRVFSYDMSPEATFAEGPSLCSTCSAEDNRSPCDDCEQALLLLSSVHHITRRLFSMIARPSYSHADTSDNPLSVQIRKEIRYRRNIVRPFRPAPTPPRSQRSGLQHPLLPSCTNNTLNHLLPITHRYNFSTHYVEVCCLPPFPQIFHILSLSIVCCQQTSTINIVPFLILMFFRHSVLSYIPHNSCTNSGTAIF